MSCKYNHDLVMWSNILTLGLPTLFPVSLFVLCVGWIPYWLLDHTDNIFLITWSIFGIFTGFAGSVLLNIFYIGPKILDENSSCPTDVTDGRYLLYVFSLIIVSVGSFLGFLTYYVIGKAMIEIFKEKKKENTLDNYFSFND